MTDRGGAEVPLFLTGVLAGVIGVTWYLVGFKVQPDQLGGVGMTYSELAALVLAAVAVLVTVLGIFVAILALWGYSQLRKSARAAAMSYVESQLVDGGALRAEINREAISHVEASMGRGGQLRAIIEARTDELIYGGAEQRAKEEIDRPFGDEDREYGG